MLNVQRPLAVAFLILLSGAALVSPAPALGQAQPAAPTFTVFATREGLVGQRTANGHRIQPRDRFVALPSTTALSSNGGAEFQVRVSYRGRSAVLPVWDVGPWNTNDDYWSPNRRYADLPAGKPMAQAAYQDGYNGGRDQSGRRIGAPNGIDIADGAFWDDLGMTQSDWVQVTFLWMGADSGAPAEAAAPTSSQAAEPGVIVIDDGGAGYRAEATVRWYDAGCGQNGRHSWTYGTADPARSENRARWSAQLPAAGFYEALAFVPPCGRPATQSARYRVQNNGAAREVVVNQESAAGSWVSLGVYHINDPAVAIELDDVTGDEGRAVRFDAIKWLPRADTVAPTARVISAARRADGSVLVRWEGSDDASGIASYDVQARALPDGAWADWQIGATTIEGAFVPAGPGGYAFRARAADWLGQQGAWREEDDARVE